jgi:hypothetical protein
MILAVAALLFVASPDVQHAEKGGGQAPALQELDFWGGEVFQNGRKLSREEAYRALGRDDLVAERERRQRYRWIGLGIGAAVAVGGQATRTTGTVLGLLGDQEMKDKLFWSGLAVELLVAPAIVGVTLLLPDEPVSNDDLRALVREHQAGMQE